MVPDDLPFTEGVSYLSPTSFTLGNLIKSSINRVESGVGPGGVVLDLPSTPPPSPRPLSPPDPHVLLFFHGCHGVLPFLWA